MANTQKILLPDVGDFDAIEVIEVIIKTGDSINRDDSIIILESDKATMEIPSPFSGVIKTINVKVGDKISEGTEIAEIEVTDASDSQTSKSDDAQSQESETEPEVVVQEEERNVFDDEADTSLSGASDVPSGVTETYPSASTAHASPGVRRFARELGVNIDIVSGSGTKGRILKEDVKEFVKSSLREGVGTPSTGGLNISPAAIVDFAKFGEVETRPLSRIRKISGAHLHRSWVTVPHVTQFDEADISSLEEFRKSLSTEADNKGVRLTPLVFIMKAVVSALQEFPEFNASLDASGENLVLKKYFHLGVAVDTPDGLVVPVIRDVNKKGIYELSAELADVAQRAREGKLMPGEMQGGCFSISSLGGIGGTQFTPIVNAPEVAILGVARAQMKPVFQTDGSFKPGLIMPLALSYDHRVIDGAQGARFTHFLSQLIADVRRILL